ncbi:MAG: hypothetical protein J6A05_04560 [Oscillospiraceae bacterium]|nr:hypothetical protein [Oscillospiraceae bacterium]
MKKAFLTLSVAGTLAFCVPTMPVKAISSENIQTYDSEAQPRAEGLIMQYGVGITAYNGQLRLTSSTIAYDTMKSIGFKDIIERSSDRDNWITEKTLDNMLLSSATEYRLTNYSVDVDGGYYYRVKCKHNQRKADCSAALRA